jgi:hypothetical protein
MGNIIKMDFTVPEYEDLEWVAAAQDKIWQGPLINMVMNVMAAQKAGESGD